MNLNLNCNCLFLKKLILISILILSFFTWFTISGRIDGSQQDQPLAIDLKDHSSVKTSDELQKVILIETDCTFNMLRLFTVIENRITAAFIQQTKQQTIPVHVQTSMNRFIKDCLKNLIVYKCNGSEQLILSLSACEYFINMHVNNKRGIMPIFIDSINANFEVCKI